MNTEEAFHMLRGIGVSESKGIQIVRRWLREGKIKYDGKGIRKSDYKINDEFLNLLKSDYPNEQTEGIVSKLLLNIKAKDEQIQGIEDLHKDTTQILIQQRDQLNIEIAALKNENKQLQNETRSLLKENIELRNELIKLKERILTGDKSEHHKISSIPVLNNYRQKLGLSKMAREKEVLTAYKELLKLAHPDRGGDARLFHYMKNDYDYFKKSMKDQ